MPKPLEVLFKLGRRVTTSSLALGNPRDEGGVRVPEEYDGTVETSSGGTSFRRPGSISGSQVRPTRGKNKEGVGSR